MCVREREVDREIDREKEIETSSLGEGVRKSEFDVWRL